MYPTPYLDRTLSYGAPDSNELSTHEKQGPVLGNGNILLHMHTNSTKLCDSWMTTVGGRQSIEFTQVRLSDAAAAVPTSSRALHIANGVYRSVAGNLVAEVMALRHTPSCVLQTVTASSPSSLEHVVSFPPGTYVARTELAIKNVNGVALPHLIVEASIEGCQVAYCCVYASSGTTYDGARYAPGGSSDCVNLLKTVGSNVQICMLHAIVHGPSVDADDAFALAALHFRQKFPPTEALSRTRATHSLRWASLWRARLHIDTKQGAPANDVEAVRRLNLHIETCMYHMFSLYLDPSAPMQSWAGHSHVPLVAHAFMPLNPWMFCWQKQPAVSTITPMYQVAGAVIDAWAAFRVTLDRARLDLHFQDLRRNVHEMQTRIEMAGASRTTPAKTSIGEVEARIGDIVEEDCYTCGMVRRALYAADQMCNALRVPPDTAWSEIRDALVVPRQNAFTLSLNDSGTDAEVLLNPALLEPYGSVTDLGAYGPLISDNTPLLNTESAANKTFAFSAIACLASDAPRQSSSSATAQRIDNCFALLMGRASEVFHPLWGAAHTLDIDRSAEFLVCLMYGFLGVRIQGYVTRDGLHSVPSSLVPGPATATLPSAWCVVRRYSTRGVGQRDEFMTQNSRDPGAVCTC